MAFLNETGLATFLSYLKAWARATFASKTDTQTIEGTTTFSQTVTGSISGNAGTATKLATARTINGVSFDGSANITVADSTKVSKTGNETIAGVKTFTDDPVISNSTPILTIKNTNDSSYGDIRFLSSDGTFKAAIRSQRDTGQFFIGTASGDGTWSSGALLKFENTGNFILRAKNSTNESSLSGAPSGSLTWSGTAPSASDDSTKLATTAWVRDATGSFACNAATASAFASSKAVTLTGAVTGTASSTGGWSVSTLWRSCVVGRTDSGTSDPWYKVATRLLNGASSTYNITFYVENMTTTNKSFGIFRVSVSTGSSKTILSDRIKFAWLANEGFAVEDFVLVCPTGAEPTVELWTKIATGYQRRRFVVISEGSGSSTSILWTLFDAVSAGQEASIPTAGTQVVSSPSSLEQRVKALEEAMNA